MRRCGCRPRRVDGPARAGKLGSRPWRALWANRARLRSRAAAGHFSGRERSDVFDVDHGKFGNIGAAIMGSTADKASGLANEAAGKAKQGIGNVVGSDKLKAEGAAQELKGDAQKATGDAKEAVKDE